MGDPLYESLELCWSASSFARSLDQQIPSLVGSCIGIRTCFQKRPIFMGLYGPEISLGGRKRKAVMQDLIKSTFHEGTQRGR